LQIVFITDSQIIYYVRVHSHRRSTTTLEVSLTTSKSGTVDTRDSNHNTCINTALQMF